MAIRKPEADAFYGTTLQQVLVERDIRHLIIVGCKSEVCIDATCRKSVEHGYQITLVSDAHSTTDNPVLRAERTIAYHNYILPMVWSDEQGEVVGVTLTTSHEVVDSLA